MVSRLERTPFAAWWWTVDRLLLAALLALMLGGIVLSLAASPPVASRLGLEPFYFVNRHVLYLIPALAVLLATSFLPPRHVRRLALVVFVGQPCCWCAATLHFGAEVKGARRWIVLLGVNIQPSEFLKPAFVILIAWLFGESARRPEMPANTMALGLLLVAVTGLVLQPDFGQTMLVALVWGALFFLAGMRLVWVVGLGGVAAVGLGGRLFDWCPHVARRIERFLDPVVRRHLQHRPGAGILPAAAAGSDAARAKARSSASCPKATPISCSRSPPRSSASCCAWCWSRCSPSSCCARLRHAMRNEDPFARFAAAGLAILFGLQSAINMAVNLHLMPAKGMTLPFISYGGSSMISLAYGMGMLLALTRERPRAELLAARTIRPVGRPA